MAPKWLFKAAISDRDYDQVIAALEPQAGYPGSRLVPSNFRTLRNRLRPWFWPYIGDAEPWASAAEGAWYWPSIYAIKEPGGLMTRLLDCTRPDSSVLDIGCNSGANLDFLRQAGFTKLFGVDVGRNALEHFELHYPETFQLAQIKHDLFQRYLLNSPSRFADVVHSNGATLELVHPSFPFVAEICRVAIREVFLDITEMGHAYPRKYIEQFRAHGFELVYCRRPLDRKTGSSILQFGRERA
ncbi:MAG: hypothetical protein JW395_1234 [Nitrospira sp.]|jgi:SAM-dependent methyltransferase|nr:hypothetical protein [Nitrospira sp.]